MLAVAENGKKGYSKRGRRRGTEGREEEPTMQQEEKATNMVP